MTVGRFILSLDCEGKWGVADHLTPAHDRTLNDERLRDAYGAIAALLARHGVVATFAFVGLFMRSADELAALPRDEIAGTLPYTRDAWRQMADGRDGWAGAWAVERVAADHEVACHGVSHTPWNDLTPAQAGFELALGGDLSGQTMIFPRNRVAHLDRLSAAGITGYRVAPPVRSRPASLLSEFDLTRTSERDPPPAPMQPIPGGVFVNWLAGARRLVPPAVTRLRARRMLRHAAATGGVAHFWTHPENIASAPATLANLRAVVEEADILRRQGRIEVVTQARYVAERHAAGDRLAA